MCQYGKPYKSNRLFLVFHWSGVVAHADCFQHTLATEYCWRSKMFLCFSNLLTHTVSPHGLVKSSGIRIRPSGPIVFRCASEVKNGNPRKPSSIKKWEHRFPEQSYIIILGGFHNWRVAQKWMAYKGKSYQNGWFRGTSMYGNPHIGFGNISDNEGSTTP